MEEMTINVKLFPADSEEVEIKQVALGIAPVIVIEGVLGDDGEPELDVSASGLTQEELSGVLELVQYTLENGEEV